MVFVEDQLPAAGFFVCCLVVWCWFFKEVFGGIVRMSFWCFFFSFLVFLASL